MNAYINLINGIIDYIDDNINSKISLNHISNEFNISEYHFNRIFKTVIGISLKKYILGRKLTKSLDKLKNTDEKVISIALDYGFEYPEVFSRAFKKQFGISPTKYRAQRETPDINNITEKAIIVERNIINYQGKVTLKGEYIYLEDIFLKGTNFIANDSEDEFEYKLKQNFNDYYFKSLNDNCIDHDFFYSIVSCFGDGSNNYNVFFGKEIIKEDYTNSFKVPKGWYVKFKYKGDMYNIRTTFIDDLYRWIMVKEVKLANGNIGMINVYNKDYVSNNGEVIILIPINM